MKKLIAILLCIATVFCLCVPAMAEESPSGEELVKATIIDKPGTKGKTNVYKVDEKIIAESDPGSGDFNFWTFFKPDGTVAIEGVDYTFVSGDKNSKTISVISKIPHLIIVANYNGKVTDPLTGEVQEPPAASQPTSPTTGNGVALGLAVLMLAGAAIVYTSKKVKA